MLPSSLPDQYAPCKIEFDRLVERRRHEFALTSKKRAQLESGAGDRGSPGQGWRPRGALIAHLHEHERGIAKLVRIPDRPIFASAAEDGCVRVSGKNVKY